jgi:uncharacterized tellurite resistance protein B-like protein
MLTQISKWMKDLATQNAAIPDDEKKLAQTIATLLVEAAMADGEIDEAEYAHIQHMLVAQLDVAEAEAAALLDDSVAAHADRIEIHSLVRAIRSQTEAADRSIILEMVWMVVLADGQLDLHESQLMRRLAGLLFVDDVESGLAAQRARARLGLAA